MDPNFHGLPPQKRFRLMQLQQQQQKHRDTAEVAPSSLPAKKRKESRDPPLLPDPVASAYCLPAKKRVWALQPDFLSDKPLSPPFDLNVEYNPVFDEQTEAVEKKHEDEDEDEDEEDDDDDEDEDGILCAICQSTDGDPSDPIVFCDGCDLMVHASCYGNPLVYGIPEGDWFCTQCLVAKTDNKDDVKALSCCLCPIKGGALKPTVDNRWAHVVCALLVPEVFFGDAEGREEIDCSKVPKRRWEDKCYLCDSSNGCAIHCSELKCPLAFHVSCGLNEDLCIEYREGRSKGAVVAAFCKDHTKLWEKQQQTGKFKIVAREEHD